MFKFKLKNRIHRAVMLIAIITFGVGSYFTTGWSNDKDNRTKGANHDNLGYRTHTITFRKGKLYEIAFASIKEGKETQLNEQYFPKVGPLVAEYGAAGLGSFRVIGKIEGQIEPQMIVIFEWPSLAVKTKFHKDPRFLKISPLRDEALSFFETSYYEVGEDVTVAFKENKIYEFFGAWLTPEAETALPKYFEVSEPIKRSYGRLYPEFKVNLSPAKGLSSDHAYSPHMAGIVEWDKAEDYYILTSNEKFKKEAAPLMKKALARIDMLQAKVIFQQ